MWAAADTAAGRSVERFDARRSHQRLEQPAERAQRRSSAMRPCARSRRSAAGRRCSAGLPSRYLRREKMPSTFRWRCRPIHSRPRQNSPKSSLDRQAGAARRLPVADRPVELLLLVPRDEGVAQQRGDVVGDRAADRVLEVEDARIRRRDHQVARHPVAVHGHLRLGQRARDQLIARRRPHNRLGARPGGAAFARDAPLGKERELAPEQGVVVGRQRRARNVASASARARRWHRASGCRRGRCRRALARREARRGRARCRGRRAGESRCATSASSTRGACRPAAAISPAMWTNGRTSSCGGGASITTRLSPSARSTRK